MDQFRSILGDNCDEDEATDAILKHNFDLEKAIDHVLNKGNVDMTFNTLNTPTLTMLLIENVTEILVSPGGNQDLRCPNVFGNVLRKGKGN